MAMGYKDHLAKLLNNISVKKCFTIYFICILEVIKNYLPSCCLHSTNGSPIVGGGQEQTGLWLIVWHIAS